MSTTIQPEQLYDSLLRAQRAPNNTTLDYDAMDFAAMDAILDGKENVQCVNLTIKYFHFRAGFRMCDFENCTFYMCVFDSCTFNNVRMTATNNDDGIQMYGCTFTNVTMTQTQINNITFINCDFHSLNIVSEVKFIECKFINGYCMDINFSTLLADDLANTQFINTYLVNARFPKNYTYFMTNGDTPINETVFNAPMVQPVNVIYESTFGTFTRCRILDSAAGATILKNYTKALIGSSPARTNTDTKYVFYGAHFKSVSLAE